jgi:C4-dicarboxylate-specific signal transduction histidine kinase
MRKHTGNFKAIKLSATFIDSSIQLERILSNIFQNAYEALSLKEDALIKVVYHEEAKHFSITVCDNGIGLYSALNHLRNKGGNLIIHSVESKGTEFVLLIPKQISVDVSKVENA